MLWALEIVSSISIGYELITFIAGNSVDAIVRLCVAIPFGFSIFIFFGSVLTLYHAMNMYHGFMIISIFIIISLVFKYLNSKRKIQTKIRFHPIQIVSILSATLFISILYSISWYYNTDTFRSEVYPDSVYHESIVQSFLVGVNSIRQNIYKIRHPYISSTKLLFDYYADLHIALLSGTGYAPRRSARVGSAVLLIFSITSGLYYLTHEITRSHLASSLSLFIFIHYGSREFEIYLKNVFQNPEYSSHYNFNTYNFNWMHAVIGHIIKNPEELYSFPSVLWGIFFIIKGKNKHTDLIIMSGIMSLILIHTSMIAYLTLVFWTSTYSILLFLTRSKKLLSLFNIFLYIILVAAYPSYFAYNYVKNILEYKYFSRFCIWKIDERQSIIYFWYKQLYAYFVIGFAFIWLSMKFRHYLIYFPSLAIFCLANAYKFQNEIRDNSIYLIFGWLPINCALVSQFLSQLLYFPKRKIIRFIFAIFFFLSMILISASSMLCYQWAMNTSTAVPQTLDNNISNWILENISPKATIAQVNYMNTNPVCLIGYQNYLINIEMLKNKGYEPVEQREKMHLMDFADNISLFANEKVDYFMQLSTARNKFSPSSNNRYWTLVYSQDNFQIWQFGYVEEVKNPYYLFVN